MSEDKGCRLNRCDAAAVCSRKKGMKTAAATVIITSPYQQQSCRHALSDIFQINFILRIKKVYRVQMSLTS
jgi:hypothetical protein